MLFNKSIASSDVLLTLKKGFITSLLKNRTIMLTSRPIIAQPRTCRSSQNNSKRLLLHSWFLTWMTTIFFLLKTSLHTDASTLQRPRYSDFCPILCQPSSRVSRLFYTWAPLLILSTTKYSKNSIDIRNMWRCVKLDLVIRAGCTQLIKIDGSTSAETLLSHGVLQGSVLRPILFILYTGELESIVRAHWLLPYSYEDENQIVFYCKPSEADNLKSAVGNCITNISAWMSWHHLKINRI